MLQRLRSFVLILIGLVCLLGSDYAAAMYDPGAGRFLQRDPSGYPDGMNSYGAYHVIRGGVDPSGLKLRIDDAENLGDMMLDWIEQDLKEICSTLEIDRSTGEIRYLPGETEICGGEPEFGPDERAGCGCMRELLLNQRDNIIKVDVGIGARPRAVPSIPGNETIRPIFGGFNPLAPWGGDATIIFGEKIMEGVPGPGTSGTVYYSPGPNSRIEETHRTTNQTSTTPAFIVLAHELCGHLLQFNRGTHTPWSMNPPAVDDNGDSIPNHERDAINIENQIREEKGLERRVNYGPVITE